MTRTLAVTLLCWALSAAAANAETPATQNPAFLVRPDASTFRENYPSLAANQAVEGFATLECYVRLDTRVECSVVAESPPSWGFGDAALAIARTFRVSPARVDGVPVEGGRIRQTIRFVLPEDNWRDHIPPEFRAYAENLAPPELPTWDMAPTSSMVLSVTPAPARASGVQGRGVLSCRVTASRTLNCEPLLETPRDSGFSRAAMALAVLFRVAESDSAFIANHTTEPFILPISFNSPPEITPVNRDNAGLGPLVLPPLRVGSDMLSERARAAGIRGTGTVLCTIQTGMAIDCDVESETPRDWGLGQLTAEAVESLPPWPVESGLIPGDQLRVTFEFGPN